MEELLKPGDYGCVHIPTFFGKLIDFFTYRGKFKGRTKKYNHAFIYLGGGLIAEAQPRGAKISPLSKYSGLEMVFDTNDFLTDEQRAGIVVAAKAIAKLRVRYGFLDIAWLGLHLMGINWRWLMSQIRKQARQICSQMVAFCGNLMGVKEWLCGEEYDQEVYPAQLADRCTQKAII